MLARRGYRSLGAPGEAAKEQAVADVLAGIPDSEEDAATIQDLVKSSGKTRAYLQKQLDALSEDGKILRLGKGRKKDPYRYFRP
jgi:hypothetical protein